MKSHGTFRVVGVRPNGDRVVITENASREVAEKVIRLIQFGSNYKDLLIETDTGSEPTGDGSG